MALGNRRFEALVMVDVGRGDVELPSGLPDITLKVSAASAEHLQ